MSNTNQLHEFKDYKALLDYLNDRFEAIAGELENILINNIPNPEASEVYLSFPATFDDLLWTKMVWSRWGDQAEEQKEKHLKDEEIEGPDLHEVMTTYFNGLVEAIAAEEFDPELGDVLPISHEDALPFPYYDGFDELPGWQKLQSLVRSYCLECFPVMGGGLHEEEDKLGICLVITSGTEKPVLEFIRAGKIENDISFVHGSNTLN